MDYQSSDVLLVMRPVYFLTKAVGLSVISLKDHCFQPLAFLYVLLLSIPLGYNIWLLFLWVYAPSNLPKTVIFFITLNDMFVYFMAVLSWIVAVVYYKSFIQMVKDAIDISSCICNVQISLPMKKLQKVQIASLVLLMTILVIKYCLDFSVDSGDSHWFGFYLADAINNIVVIQFTNLMWILETYYGSINERMSSYTINGVANEIVVKTPNTLFKTPTKPVLRRVKVSTILVQAQNSADYLIKDMQSILNSVFLMSQLVNGLFTLQLLFYMANFIIEITVSLYILYYNGVFKVSNEDLVDPFFWTYIFSQILIILLDSFQIVIMISASEGVADEVNSTHFVKPVKLLNCRLQFV